MTVSSWYKTSHGNYNFQFCVLKKFLGVDISRPLCLYLFLVALMSFSYYIFVLVSFSVLVFASAYHLEAYYFFNETQKGDRTRWEGICGQTCRSKSREIEIRNALHEEKHLFSIKRKIFCSAIIDTSDSCSWAYKTNYLFLCIHLYILLETVYLGNSKKLRQVRFLYEKHTMPSIALH